MTEWLRVRLYRFIGTDQIASFCFTLAIGIVALNPEV